MKKFVLLPIMMTGIILMLICGPALAFEPIPNESGFSGYVRAGVGYVRVSSNMIAGNNLGDVGQRKINSLKDNPNSESDVIPAFNFNLNYTFASTRTQLFAGNRLEDVLRYDFTTQAGVRQQMGGLGIGGVSFVFSSLPTQVWKDPYVVNERRRKTNRTSTGVRLAWENILGSNLEVDYIYRSIDLGNDRSGKFLGLTSSQRHKLDRNGDSHQASAAYLFHLAKRHIFTPKVTYTYLDLDGNAMANQGIAFQPTYGYLGSKFELVLNGVIGYADFDSKNPIYRKTRNDTSYGGGAIGFWKNPFGWKPFGIEKFRLYVQSAYLVFDSNIDFYDTDISYVAAGIQIGF